MVVSKMSAPEYFHEKFEIKSILLEIKNFARN